MALSRRQHPRPSKHGTQSMTFLVGQCHAIAFAHGLLRLGAGATATFPARSTAVAHVAIDHDDYGKMAWQQVWWNDEADDGKGAWEDVEDGRHGEIAEPTHAREINGRPMVPPGTIVLMSLVTSPHNPFSA